MTSAATTTGGYEPGRWGRIREEADRTTRLDDRAAAAVTSGTQALVMLNGRPDCPGGERIEPQPMARPDQWSPEKRPAKTAARSLIVTRIDGAGQLLRRNRSLTFKVPTRGRGWVLWATCNSKLIVKPFRVPSMDHQTAARCSPVRSAARGRFDVKSAVGLK